MSSQMNNKGNKINRNNKMTHRRPVYRPNVLNENGEQISLFIPRVDRRTTFEKISFVFHYYFMGKVKNVDFVLKHDKNGFEYKSAYVHFDHFYNSQNACTLIDTIRNSGSDMLCCDKYDKDKKWIVLINTGTKHVAGNPRKRLDLDLLEVNIDNNDDDDDDKSYSNTSEEEIKNE